LTDVIPIKQLLTKSCQSLKYIRDRGAVFLCRGRIQGKTMKIAFSTSGSTLDSPLDTRFGRAPHFLIFDLDTETFQVVDNRQSLDSAQGAGIQSAETVARQGVKALVSGHCGPKAFRVLQAAGIRIFTSNAGTVRDALEQYRAGSLAEAGSADVEGHWV
jgi:predicted Fe-Mo cluster-binding NifX family protein